MYNCGAMIEAGLPNIYGRFEAHDLTDDMTPATSSGALYHYPTRNRDAGDGNYHGEGPKGIGLDASRCSAIYGKSNTVQPNACALYYIMKL